jgi:predicted nucleotidyltransferase
MIQALAGLKTPLPLKEIESLCRKYAVEELSVFGSILRDDYNDESDIDFLVRFKANDAGPWGVKYDDLAGELSNLLGRKVDLVSKNGIESSSNYLRRHQILSTARVIYAA